MAKIQQQAKTTVVVLNETFDSLRFQNLYFTLLKKSSGDTAIDFCFIAYSSGRVRVFERALCHTSPLAACILGLSILKLILRVSCHFQKHQSKQPVNTTNSLNFLSCFHRVAS